MITCPCGGESRVTDSRMCAEGLEMFEPPESERGCMRWGLCETHDDDGDDE